MLRSSFLVLSLLACFVSSAVSANAEPARGKIILLPVHVENAGKYDVLKDTVTQMIMARLSNLSGYSCEKKDMSSADQKLFVQGYPLNTKAFFQKMKADIIVMGEVAAVGNGLFLEIKFFKELGTKPRVLSGTAKGEQEVLPVIDTVLAKVDDSLLEDDTFLAVAPLTGSKGLAGFQTDHPDRKYKSAPVAELTPPADNKRMMTPLSPQHTAFPVQREIAAESALSGEIMALAAGDADGDGHPELFAAFTDRLALFSVKDGEFEELDHLPLAEGLSVQALNVADVDNDGKAEIYLSSLKDKNFSSSVYTWAPASGFQVVVKDIPWAIRPLKLPGGYRIVAGQKMPEKDSPAAPEIRQLRIDPVAGSVQKGGVYSLPEGVSLFDFVYADLEGDGIPEIVALSPHFHLVVFDETNKPVWISTLRLESTSAPRDKEDASADLFSVRMVAFDTDGDGREELFAVQNQGVQGKGHGSALCLRWTGRGMAEIWQSEAVDGTVVDMAFERRKVGSSTAGSPSVRLFLAEKETRRVLKFFRSSAPKSGLLLFD